MPMVSTTAVEVKGVAYSRLPPARLGESSISPAAAHQPNPGWGDVSVSPPSFLPGTPAVSFASHSSTTSSGSAAFQRLNNVVDFLSESIPDVLNPGTVSCHAQRLVKARFELAGFNDHGEAIQTDLRFLRKRHDNAFGEPARARLTGAQFELNRQVSSLLCRVLPAGVLPAPGVSNHLVLETLPQQTQAQVLLACLPSHLLTDSEMRIMGLPPVHQMIAIAAGREAVPAAQPWPWRSIHAQLNKYQGDDLLVGKSRHRDSIPKLAASYGHSLEGSERNYTFGTRLERACKWLYFCISCPPNSSAPKGGLPLTEKNLALHSKMRGVKPV